MQFLSAVRYNAAKHSVIGITKPVALEYAPRNIRVNADCPGYSETTMLNGVADAATRLLSNRSSHLTGVALPADGEREA